MHASPSSPLSTEEMALGKPWGLHCSRQGYDRPGHLISMYFVWGCFICSGCFIHYLEIQEKSKSLLLYVDLQDQA